MNFVCLTGIISGEPEKFTFPQLHGAQAYRIDVICRDAERPKKDVKITVVMMPGVLDPLKEYLEKGGSINGSYGRFEGNIRQGYFMDKGTKRIIPTNNVYVKSFEIYNFDSVSRKRIAASEQTTKGVYSALPDYQGE